MNDQELRELVTYLAQFVTSQRWEKIQRVALNRTRHLTVVFEHINQPLNLSAALRTIEGLGIQDTYIVDSQEFKSEINSGVTKGAEAWLTLHRYHGIEGVAIRDCIGDLRARGYSIIATMPHVHGQPPETLDLNQKTAIVFGNEEFGVSTYAQENSVGFLKVPMYGFTESFNVSATVAMCIHTLVERLKTSGIFWQLNEGEILHLCHTWLKKSLRDPTAMERVFFQKSRDDDSLD